MNGSFSKKYPKTLTALPLKKKTANKLYRPILGLLGSAMMSPCSVRKLQSTPPNNAHFLQFIFQSCIFLKGPRQLQHCLKVLPLTWPFKHNEELSDICSGSENRFEGSCLKSIVMTDNITSALQSLLRRCQYPSVWGSAWVWQPVH